MHKKFLKAKGKLVSKGSRHSQPDIGESTPRSSESRKSIAEPIVRAGISLVNPISHHITTGSMALSSAQKTTGKTTFDRAGHPASPRSSLALEGTSNAYLSKSDAIQTGWNGFKFTLNVLKDASAVFPPLQIAVGGLVVAIDKIEKTLENKDNFKVMIEQLNALAGFIERYQKDKIYPNVRDRLEGLAQSIEKRTEFIEERVKKGRFKRFINAADDADDIITSLRELTFAVQLFQLDSTEDTRQVVTDLHERELLKILDAVGKAPYNASGRSECMDGTRLDTLSRLFAWAADPKGERVLWLNGMAGIGKSAIALSFCKAMAVQGHLGGSFFCFRQSQLLNNVKHILPTIAFQLARRFSAYRHALVQIMAETSYTSYSFLGLEEQAKDLFIELVTHLRDEKRLLVIVIDALDECSSHSAVKDFLKILLRSDLPLKFLITSRPETHIEKGFSRMGRSEIDDLLAADARFRQDLFGHASLLLHDVEADMVEGDISRYLARKLSAILDDVKQADIAALAKRSGKLFIFAFTAVQYILAGVDSNLSMTELKRRLTMMIGSQETQPSALSMQTIDILYAQIFDSAYTNKEVTEKKSLRDSLDTLLCLREPQPTSVIAALLKKQPYDVRSHLANFRSVLDIPKEDNVPVYTFHTSFLDYVLDEKRAGTYTLDAQEQHEKLGLACLQLMNQLLHEDMCGIKTRQTPNADISQAVMDEKISSSLRYACVSWGWHLDQCLQMDSTQDVSHILRELEIFVDLHLLHWLECLSLIEELRLAFDASGTAQPYLALHGLYEHNTNVRKSMLVDTQRMILQCNDFIQNYALEVYVSALKWLPVESALRAKFTPKQSPEVLRGLARNWGSRLEVLKTTDLVDDVAYSPNGAYVAVVSGPRTEIWDPESGQIHGKLEGHTDMVKSVAFSPDGSKIASGSLDATVRIWDVKTQELQTKLEDHAKFVTCVKFSPDGSKLACGDADKTVYIWDVGTGVLETKLEGHIYRVNAIAFSPDGSQLASASGDQTVCIWDVSAGVMQTRLEDHTDEITSVEFFPDGRKLVFGSCGYKRICIWDIQTGTLQSNLEGHAHDVTAIAISPDGSKLASGSWDMTVCIWDLATGILQSKLEGHAGGITSVAFSPDGSKLISGSGDKTAFIWDVETSVAQATLDDHVGRVTSVAFALDSSKVASGSNDKTACVWDLQTGAFQTRFEGHVEPVTSVAMSAEASKLASGSRYGAVRVWNAATGVVQSNLMGHSLWITSITFSLDGSKLASGSGDGIVCTWDIETGVLHNKLDGHTKSVISLAFSPDGTKLASESRDKVVCIWNFKTGDREHELKATSLDLVPSALFLQIAKPTEKYFLSDDRKCVVTKANDGTVQPKLWIMSEYRANISRSAFFRMYGVIGYQSGRVVILKLDDDM